MAILCYSVKVKEIYSISDKCLKVVCFDGSSDLIPVSQYYGRDWDVEKSESHWISAWILERKDLQYSPKKSAEFEREEHEYLLTQKRSREIIIETHIPLDKSKAKVEHDSSLFR